MAISDDFQAHLESGHTTLARAWSVTRADGVNFGFTDHDCDLSFEGMVFSADTGLSASTLQQSTGISVDNSEALGVLTDSGVSEADLEAGRFDGAEVQAWLVNWADSAQRHVLFRGTIGEIRRANGAFQAELRGLTEALNRPVGRVFQKPCTAVLGDVDCGFDTDTLGYSETLTVEAVTDARVFEWAELNGYEPGWFARGRFEVLTGAAAGLTGMIKADKYEDDTRRVELWAPIRAAVAVGDQVKLVAGCDKRFETCRLKFNNLLNFQGFPDIPGDDWLMSYPRQSGDNSGGSLR